MPKGTLADKITGVLNTAPKSFDPEEDDLNFTKPDLLEADSNDEDGEDFEQEVVSKLRRANVSLLDDDDVRYAGKKASRKSLKDFDDDDDEEESMGNSVSQDEKSDIEDSEEETDDSEEDKDSQISQEDNEDETSDEDDMGSEVDSEQEADESGEDIQHMTERNLSAEVKKGLCVRNQLSIWETLLETRIQLQKCLIAANKMPQTEKFHQMKKQAGPEFKKKVTATKKSVSNVLDKLLELQTLVLNKYPETKNLGKESTENSKEDSDEEIHSDTEEENSVNGDIMDTEIDDEEIPKKKRKLGDYETEISDQFTKYKKYRNKIIQLWNEKTSIGSLKSNTSTHSVLNQIESILSDKSKLVRRTQCKRSNYKILGEEEKVEEQSVSGTEERIYDEEYNSNIFDDDDFYHQLLRELIEFKSADLSDPVQLGRQWIQLQSMRKKMKRNIDTRATKGRKIRYAVHTKLVNTMAPIEKTTLTDEAINEIYGSLFGKKQLTV